MIDLIINGDGIDLVKIREAEEFAEDFDLELVDVLCDQLEDVEYGYGVHKEKKGFCKEPVLLGERILLIPAEIWISRRDMNDHGIIWYHKDFDIKEYLLQEYSEEYAEILFYKIENFNKYEEFEIAG